MEYYSFAGDVRGTTDPEDVYFFEVSEEDCDIRGCVRSNCSHYVLMWSGNEYSKNHTWIACDKKYVVNLEDCR